MADPLRIRLGQPLRDWQRAVAGRSEKYRVLALHRRAGKTELALRKLIDSALRFSLDLGLFFYVAPYLKQAKAIAWARAKQIVEPLRVLGRVEINESELFLRFPHNGAVVRIFGADNPDAMRGVRLDGVVVDEVAQIKPETWEEILQPTLADRDGWAWFIGTPNGVNLFSQLFFAAAADTLGEWWAARYTCHETDALPAERIESMRRGMSEQVFAREMLCDFAAAGDAQLISLADIEVAAARVLQRADYEFAPKVIGVDPARFGDDRSVILMRQGLAAHAPLVFRGMDNMALVGRVAQEIEAQRPASVFVDSGAGAGVIDRLRQLGHAVVEVPFGGAASDSRYLNKRAEMWFALRDWIAAGGMIPDTLALKADLAAPTYRYTSAGKLALESKDEIKARGQPSPDIADALALTFAHPVALPRQGARNSSIQSYDPYANL